MRLHDETELVYLTKNTGSHFELYLYPKYHGYPKLGRDIKSLSEFFFNSSLFTSGKRCHARKYIPNRHLQSANISSKGKERQCLSDIVTSEQT